MINDKLKVFVRYNPGACGHFIALMVLSLTKPIHMIDAHRGHMNIDDINHNHNFGNQWNPAFKRYTSSDSDITLEKRVRYIQSNFEFYPTDNPLYIVHTHAVDPASLINAFDNTQLITITNREQDIPQLAYNWATKNVPIAKPWRILNSHLHYIQTIHKKLLEIPPNSIDGTTPLELVTYIQAHSSWYVPQLTSNDTHRTFTIQFIDIMNKNVIAQLDDLISFLGITVSEERKQATIQMIHSYVDNQIIIPFDVSLDAFD